MLWTTYVGLAAYFCLNALVQILHQLVDVGVVHTVQSRALFERLNVAGFAREAVEPVLERENLVRSGEIVR